MEAVFSQMQIFLLNKISKMNFDCKVHCCLCCCSEFFVLIK